MAGRLRRLPGTYFGPQPYVISNSLDGVVPGRRTIAKLVVSRLGADATEGLRPLAAFPDLRDLELEWPVDIDLAPVANLSLERLLVKDGKDLDLEPLAEIATLEVLDIISPDRCSVPDDWRLSTSLKSVALMVDANAHALLHKAIAAIRWHELKGLEALALAGAMTSVDLGFLADLPQLRYLDLRELRHAGAKPSPLEPPFIGLPRHLIGGLIEVPASELVRTSWLKHIGPSSDDPEQRPCFRDLPEVGIEDDTAGPAGAWHVQPPATDDDVWSSYGSLYGAAEGQTGDTEHEARRAAQRRLHAADPALLRRLDFDPEADGTGIYACNRRDLDTALQILGLTR